MLAGRLPSQGNGLADPRAEGIHKDTDGPDQASDSGQDFAHLPGRYLAPADFRVPAFRLGHGPHAAAGRAAAHSLWGLCISRSRRRHRRRFRGQHRPHRIRLGNKRGALFANPQATAAQGAAGRLRPPEPDSYGRRPRVLHGSGGAVRIPAPPTSDRGRPSQPRTAFSHRRLRPGTRILAAKAVLVAKVRPRSTSAFSTASATLLPRPVRSPSQIRAVMHNAIRF